MTSIFLGFELKTSYNHKFEGVNSFYDLRKGQLIPIFQKAIEIFNQKEQSKSPAAGYEFYIRMISSKRPLEFELNLIGGRKEGTPLEMPQIKGGIDCAMCNNKTPMEGYGVAGLAASLVIKSLEGNPLAISSRGISEKHAQHAFELNPEELEDITLSAIKALKIRTGGTSTRSQIAFHVGTVGHQTFPHAHAHVTTALGFKKKKTVAAEPSSISLETSMIKTALSTAFGGAVVAFGHVLKVFANTTIVHGALFSLAVSLISQIALPILKKYRIECDKYSAGATVAILLSTMLKIAGVASTVSALGALVLTLSTYSADYIIQRQ